ncbi:MAG TPA: acyl-CoA dehydrogenase family protein [Solirubrobacteraceae bacterium]
MSLTVDADRGFVDQIRRIGEDVAAVHADAVDHDARFPHEAVAALREAGALSAFVPVALGGAGVSIGAMARAGYELGRRCSSTAMIFAMHQIQVATIARHLEGEWFRSYLRRVAAEQRLIASVTSEVGTGGDMGRSIAPVTPDGDGFALEKQAPTVSYGAHADDLFTTARRSPQSEQVDQALVLHHAEQTELLPTGTWDTIGMRGTCSPGFTVRAHFGFDQILPAPFATVMNETHVPLSHILWSHVWLGIAAEAFERGRAFVRASARRNPGAPVPAAHSLSRVMSELTMMRAEVESALADYVAFNDDPERPDLATLTSVLRFNNLKLAASEQAPRVCMGVLEVIGIAAYKNDSPYGVGRQLRDALSARLMVANERIHSVDAGLLMIAKEV